MKLPDYSWIKAKVALVRRRLPIPARLHHAPHRFRSRPGWAPVCQFNDALAHVSWPYVIYGVWPMAVLVALGFGVAGRAIDWFRSARKNAGPNRQTPPDGESSVGKPDARIKDNTR